MVWRFNFLKSMQRRTEPSFFLTTTIGEANGDSCITPKSRSSWRCFLMASTSWVCIGRGLYLNGVSSLNLIRCFTLYVQNPGHDGRRLLAWNSTCLFPVLSIQEVKVSLRNQNSVLSFEGTPFACSFIVCSLCSTRTTVLTSANIVLDGMIMSWAV